MSGFLRSIVNHQLVAGWFRPLLRRTVTLYSVHRFAGRYGMGVDALAHRLELIRDSGAKVLPLHELTTLAESGQPIPDRAVAFTVDDGYRDFAEVGAEVFADFGFPVTVFLITGFLDKQMWPWWDQIDYCLTRTDHASVRIETELVTLQHPLRGEGDISYATEALSARLKALTLTQRSEVMEKMASDLGVEIPAEPPTEYQPLTWDQVRSFNGSGVSFGPHTVLHPILSRESRETAQREIVESWNRLREEIEHPVPVFAYPNGTLEDFSDREVEILGEAGLEAALTTEYNYVTEESWVSRYRWPRFPFECPEHGFAQIVSGAERAKNLIRGAVLGRRPARNG